MFMYTSSRRKCNRSHIKSEFQMFSLISGRYIGVPRKDTIMASAFHRPFRQITEERCTAQT